MKIHTLRGPDEISYEIHTKFIRPDLLTEVVQGVSTVKLFLHVSDNAWGLSVALSGLRFRLVLW
jgi:hypothetical protein